LPQYCISQVDTVQEKEFVIHKCGCAFPVQFQNRKVNRDLLNKICICAEVVVAYDSTIKGYAAMYTNDYIKFTAYITLITVHPGHQRKSVGYSLLKQCINIATYCGMKTIRLEVKRENYAAINLYEKCGFSVEIEHGTDSLYLTKKIGEVMTCPN